ncbi:MAG TPA: helix-turn-helix domain-containing protein [Methylomusa anaerophila]|uniref:Helix-turn-helix conjugative transposon-like domain-containing protein n=1 Tax=Methylomusa anaerophila TaxID=1930071 RepID=A0A348ANL4_9FIRM|nr:helix-turn-helix domain-containing protein [Methylomusa anaerophila]BBB92662.1 hypothetical protein MAMMFC1_03357 [Methylomusa anaerophila]HML87485.1 helix-turn-helix domain-containing protein [Methylomusa anaerophila]
MKHKPKLKELIIQAQNGNTEATAQLVFRLSPLVRKYSRQLGYDEACSDLVTWIVEAIHRYQPSTMGKKGKLERGFSTNPAEEK